MRSFEGTKRGIDVNIDIFGWRHTDGSVERHAVIGRDIFLDAAAAREAA